MPTDRPRKTARSDAFGSVRDDTTGRRCRAVVEPRDDGVELCTIYSIDPDDDLTATWLSAPTGSFTTVGECR